MKKLIVATGFIVSTLFSANLADGKKEFDNKQYEKSYKTFMQIANEGMVAKFNIGFMYEKGLGVKQNFKKALIFYKLSANDGYAQAQNAMGNAYTKGIGVKKDLNIAKAYFELSAKQNNKNAIASLKAIKKFQTKNDKATKGYLTIRSNVNNDKVYIDGKYIGKTKITIPLDTNIIHKVEVRKYGYKTYKFRDIKLKTNEKRTVKAYLTKEI